ncbi:unnamed protein product [Lathyrus sativus]|nr:unnamed protein product [Lathyrus sativus]
MSKVNVVVTAHFLSPSLSLSFILFSFSFSLLQKWRSFPDLCTCKGSNLFKPYPGHHFPPINRLNQTDFSGLETISDLITLLTGQIILLLD